MEFTAQRMKTYTGKCSASKFIGKHYREKDKRSGTYGWLWDEWFDKDMFAPIESLTDASIIEDSNSHLGMNRYLEDGGYEYWIGMIVPENAPVPEGYDSFLIPACDTVTNWIYGKEPVVYFYNCIREMKAQGLYWNPLATGDKLMAERYVLPRFSDPDEFGNIILDMVYFTSPEEEDFEDVDLEDL